MNYSQTPSRFPYVKCDVYTTRAVNCGNKNSKYLIGAEDCQDKGRNVWVENKLIINNNFIGIEISGKHIFSDICNC